MILWQLSTLLQIKLYTELFAMRFIEYNAIIFFNEIFIIKQ